VGLTCAVLNQPHPAPRARALDRFRHGDVAILLTTEVPPESLGATIIAWDAPHTQADVHVRTAEGDYASPHPIGPEAVAQRLIRSSALNVRDMDEVVELLYATDTGRAVLGEALRALQEAQRRVRLREQHALSTGWRDIRQPTDEAARRRRRRRKAGAGTAG
jgi:hypothetical protein